MRDTQRAKVYAWENAFITAERSARPEMTLWECQQLVDEVRAAYGWGHVVVKDGRRRRRACCSGHTIKLPRWSRQRGVVLHEAAHSLTHDSHGPQFMRVYLDLLARWTDLPIRELRAAAAKARIRVARKAHVPRSRPARVVAKIAKLEARRAELLREAGRLRDEIMLLSIRGKAA